MVLKLVPAIEKWGSAFDSRENKIRDNIFNMGFRQLLERNREHSLLDKNWSSETAWKDEKKWIRDWLYPDYSTVESDNAYSPYIFKKQWSINIKIK